MKASPIIKLMDEWQAAFRAANGKEPPRITYNRGWYMVAGSSRKYRRRQFEQMRDRLNATPNPTTVAALEEAEAGGGTIHNKLPI